VNIFLATNPELDNQMVKVLHRRWRTDYFDVLCSKALTEGGGELRIPIIEAMAIGWRWVFNHPAKLARLLGNSAGGWMLNAASDVDSFQL
jgi:hypothetical protein